MYEKDSTILLKEFKKLNTAIKHSRRTAILLVFILQICLVFLNHVNVWVNVGVLTFVVFLIGFEITASIYLKQITPDLTQALVDDKYIEVINKFVGEYDIKDKQKVEKQYKIKIKQTPNIEKFYLYRDTIHFTKHHNTYQGLINEIYKNYKNYYTYSYKITKDNYYSNLLNIELEDDKTEVGGISFEGYTLKDYLEETGLIKDVDQLLFEPNLTTLNKHLIESRIKPIKTQNN